MNVFSFFRLLRTIYADPEPDIEYIQSLGLLAVKIGQVFALRPDFLNDERCRVLARLYSNTTSLPPEDSLALIASYAGSTYLDNFASFNPQPFASASIGQVHRAVLKTGEQVAVKIVKKDYTRTFRRDATSVRRLFKFAIFFYPKLRGVANPVSLLREIEKMTLSELDLRNEAAGARELKYASLLELFHIHGFFMFCIGTFHGDIHPGNLVLKDGSFYFLDTGYIGRVSERMRKNLFYFFEALSAYDYAASARCLNAMAERSITGRAFADFEKKFLALYADFTGKTVSQVSLTKKMMQTIRLGVLSGMHFDEGMFDIIKSLMYLDGMVIRANPDAVLLQDMRRFIDEFKGLIG